MKPTSAGTAPANQFGDVLDYATGQFTLQAALTATPSVGALYAVGRRKYPRDVLTQFVNAAYRDLGQIPNTDTTLYALTDNTQYTIPAGVSKDLREVWVQTLTADSTIKGWYEIPRGMWRQELNILYMPQLNTPDDTTYTLKLVYVDEPSELTIFSSAISEYVHPKRIIYKAAANCLMWRSENLHSAQALNALNQKVNYFLDLDQKAKYDHPIVLPARPNRYFHVVASDVHSTSNIAGRVGTVDLS